MIDITAGGMSTGLSSNLEELSSTSTSSLKNRGRGSGIDRQGVLHGARLKG